MKAKIKDKKEIADGTLAVTFDLLGKEIKFKPGQYFFVVLEKPPYLDDQGAIRHFSIVNSPNEKGIIKMATRIRESAFKRSLKEMPLGSWVEIDSIGGNFILPKDTAKLLTFITGGIGITPFMSMLKFATEEKLNHKITCLYSNKNRASTAFFQDLKKLAKKNKNLKLVFTMTQDPDWKGEKRRIDADFISEYVDNPAGQTFFIAGPPEMVKAVFERLIAMGIKKSNIFTENFAGY